MQIYRTRDYSSFKVILSNREVNKSHVEKLARSIEKKNLLFIRPLIVNDRMEIIDGQHRLAACEKLEAEVHYVKVDGLTREDITVLNTAQKNWTMMDFINFYAIEGRPEYKEFSRLINKYSMMKVTTVLRLCGASKNVRDGKLDISGIRIARRVCEWIQALAAKGFEFVYERDFGLALNATVVQEKTFDHLVARITEDNFTKCGSRPEYSRMIKRIID